MTTDKRPGIYLALAPWILFTVLAQHAGVQVASLVALAAAAAISLPGLRAHRPKLLELGAVATFAAFSVVAFTVDAQAADWLARYARGIAAGVLALISFGSLAFTPFTEQYARESVPERLWGSATFRAVNRELTTLWACVFTAMIPLHVIAGSLDTRQGNLVFNWLLPITLVVWASKRTSEASAGTPTPAAA
jgi:hypothetical protein